MRWQGRRRSTNVEDRRGIGRGGIALGGGIGTIIVLLIAVFLGADPTALLNGLQDQGLSGGSPSATVDAQDPRTEFVSVVLADTEDVWTTRFDELGRVYSQPTLVLFSGSVRSACGLASAAVGPFYCPADQKVYLDLAFFDELTRRYQAPGDFAQAYVIAHEVGHHVQKLLGISDQVHSLQQRVGETESNDLSVRLELQADFFAGIWAHDAQTDLGVVEAGDIDEALATASAIGDDRLQQQSQGYVVPDSFTHGTSEQRARWFRRGYESGDMSLGDTFSAGSL